MTAPAHFQGLHGPEEVLGIRLVGHRIIIHEEDAAGSHGPDVAQIPQDVRDGASSVAVAVVLGDGAVLAGERTPSGDEKRKLKVVVPIEGLPHELLTEEGEALQIHSGQAHQVVKPASLVDPLPEAAGPKVP